MNNKTGLLITDLVSLNSFIVKAEQTEDFLVKELFSLYKCNGIDVIQLGNLVNAIKTNIDYVIKFVCNLNDFNFSYVTQ